MSATNEIVAQGVPARHGNAADTNQDGTVTRSEAAAYDEGNVVQYAPTLTVLHSIVPDLIRTPARRVHRDSPACSLSHRWT